MPDKIHINDLPAKLVNKMEGPIPWMRFGSDGCSCSPDEIGGIDLRPACHFHDWAYHVGGNRKARKVADQALYRNLKECGLGRFLSQIYYRRVRFHGFDHFNWDEGRKPSGLLHRVHLFFSRYIRF